MELTFLEAAMPLTKTFAYARGVYGVTPYPMAARLTSYEVKAKDLNEFESLLREHAAQGHALLRGALDVPLVRESRAGHKLEKPTEWVVFDFDKVKGNSFDDVIKRYLPACCQGVQYVGQYSASMQLTPESFSGHIFMQLDQPTDLTVLKDWFTTLNMTTPALLEQMTLTASATTLHWPLDVAVTRAAQIIYIAPPKCLGFTPPRTPEQLIVHGKGKQAKLRIPAFSTVGRDVITDKINELRENAGLERHDLKVVIKGDIEVLVKSERGTVHDVKPSGDHHLTFNLNGGDSRGYFIDLRNPALIGNFKGEPYLRTEQVDPDFYKALVKQTGRVLAQAPIDEGTEPLAFYATNRQSEIMIGSFSAATRELRLEPSTAQAASAWLAGYGVVKAGHIPHSDVIFDPQSDIQYAYGLPVINIFRATDYMVRPRSSEKKSTVDDIPRVIRKVLHSICGSDDATMQRFVNWLALLFQTRKKIGSAWVLHGIEGTGKGVFVKFVLRPLFGNNAVRNVLYSQATARFNDFLDDVLIVVFEEATMSATENSEELQMKLLHWTTDSPLLIEGKNKKAVQRDNFANFIFDSNQRDPVIISKTNRRFNVSPRQENKLIFTPSEFASIEGGDELEAFADVLLRWPVDAEAARTVIDTRQAELMHQQTVSPNQLIAEALLSGDTDFFITRMPSAAEAMAEFGLSGFDPLPLYRELMVKIIDGEAPYLRYEDIFILFRTLIPDQRFFKNSKLWYIKHFEALGILQRPIKVGRRTVQGVPIEWKPPEHEFERPAAKLKAVK